MPTTYELTECPHCGEPLTSEIIQANYSEFYDAYFCPACRNWLEKSCGSSTCEYCANRPPKALPAKYANDDYHYRYFGVFDSLAEAQGAFKERFEKTGSCVDLNPLTFTFYRYYEEEFNLEIAVNMEVNLIYDEDGFYVVKYTDSEYQSTESTEALFWKESGMTEQAPKLSEHYQNAQFATLYDVQNRGGADDDFFLRLANKNPQSQILDLGCGTGRLALALAQAEHRVTGIDPAAALLEIARNKQGSQDIHWIQGTAQDAPSNTFDLVLMTSHVAQIFTDDSALQETLQHIYRSLRSGGKLAFDSRDPLNKAWENWDSGEERDVLTLPTGETVETWFHVHSIHEDIVHFSEYAQFSPTKKPLVSESYLRFRSKENWTEHLAQTGFEVEDIYGGWYGEKVGEGCGELVFVAKRPK